MDNIKIDVAKIKSIAPKAWKDVEEFYQSHFPLQAKNSALMLESMPFEMILGILLRYFIENGVEWDVSNTEFEFLPETLLEVFENYEKTISHYS